MAGAGAAAAAAPTPKPRAPRAPRTTAARNGSAAAARTPAAKKPAARTAAAKKPATPRKPAAKKPAAPRGSATPKTAAAAAAADASVVSATGPLDGVAVADDVVETPAVQDASAGSAAVVAAPEETPVAPADPRPSAADEHNFPSRGDATSTGAFADLVIPPRPPLPPHIDAPAPVGESIGADSAAAEVAVDPTPADVAVEEPLTAPSADTTTDDADTSSDAVGETGSADPSTADVITTTPLETADDDDDRTVVLDLTDGHGLHASDVSDPALTEAESAPLADTEDPTPPDVRVDDEATADAADGSTGADVADDGVTDDAAADDADTDVVAADSAAFEADATETAADVERSDEDGAPRDAAEADSVVAEDDAALRDAADGDDTATPEGDQATGTTTAVLAADPSATDPSVDADTDAAVSSEVPALSLRHITKTFGDLRAVDAIDLTVPAGSFYGLVGPNGAGKTTTLSIIAGLLRADAGEVTINGVDAKKRAREAKKLIGVLPDRLRTFDRLTGRQLLSYYGALRGLPGGLVESRTADLARAFDLVEALARPVSDYSAGMTKKVMLAGAMIHSPRLLVLDEPFEAVDPVSSGVILDILRTYVDHGGTVILSSHGMELVERVCSRVAVIVSGQVLAEGTVDEVRGEGTLEERFRELSGGLGDVEGLEWLHTFSA